MSESEYATDERQETGLRTPEFCRQFLAIARKKLTGTLSVTSADAASKSFLCHNGTIGDLDTGGEYSLLTQVLLEKGSVSPRQLKKAQKNAEKSERSLGAVLMEMDLVPEDELLKAIEESVTEEVTEVFSWDIEQSSFQSHEADETIEGFLSELSEYFDLLADPETLFLEAAQRLDRWDLVQECFDLLLDVFYATPGTFSYFREPETYPAEIRILGAVDGNNDVEEVIRESGLDHFTAIEVIRNLIRDGAIELINPVQMFQLGTQAAASENMEKACRLYRRAKERGLNDFDIELRLAHCLEVLGRKKEAAASYFEFSNKCLGQLRVDDALRSLRRVVKLSPDQKEAMVKLLELLIQHNRIEEAFETAMGFSARLEKRGDPAGALDLLLPLRDTGLRDVKLHERIIELAETCDDQDLVRSERELVAQTFHDRRGTAEALEVYQRLYCEGNDTLEVRLKLIELHKDQGNRQKAIDHINAVLSLGGRKRVKDEATLLELHETMRELQPADVRSNRWLIEYHLKNNEKDKAARALKTWLPDLQKAGDHEELVNALKKLIALEDHLQYRWTLAAVLEKMQRDSDSRRELRGLAHHAMRRREFDQAAKALEHILRSSPLDTETRKAQAELYDMRGEKELAAEKLKELATLEIIAGNIQEAEVYCRQFLISQPDDAEVVDKFGMLCLELGDTQKAVEQFLKAAKIHLENKNFGLARKAVDRLLKARPQHQEGNTLLARLQGLEPQVGARPEKAREETPPSPTPTPRKVPFENAAPVKTTVSGITARLRKLKSGGTPKSKGRQAAAVGDIAARLKSLKGGTGGASPAGAPETEASGGSSPGDREAASGASEGLGNPRLQGIQLSGAPLPKLSAAALPKISAGAQQPAQTQTPTMALKSAAARLKALSSKKKPSPESPSDGPEDARPDEAPSPGPPPSRGDDDKTLVPADSPPDASLPPGSAEGEGTTIGPSDRPLDGMTSPPAPAGEEVTAEPEEGAPEAAPSSEPAATQGDDDTTVVATPPDFAGEGGDAPGRAPTTAQVKQKLGGAASRLAALWKDQ